MKNKKALLFLLFWLFLMAGCLLSGRLHAQVGIPVADFGIESAYAKFKADSANGYMAIDNKHFNFFTGPTSYQITDSAGPWLIWMKDSDTLELIRPLKVHYIKMGKKIIRLTFQDMFLLFFFAAFITKMERLYKINQWWTKR